LKLFLWLKTLFDEYCSEYYLIFNRIHSHKVATATAEQLLAAADLMVTPVGWIQSRRTSGQVRGGQVAEDTVHRVSHWHTTSLPETNCRMMIPSDHEGESRDHRRDGTTLLITTPTTTTRVFLINWLKWTHVIFNTAFKFSYAEAVTTRVSLNE